MKKRLLQKTLTKELTLGSDEEICFSSTFSTRTRYSLKMRIAYQGMSIDVARMQSSPRQSSRNVFGRSALIMLVGTGNTLLIR